MKSRTNSILALCMIAACVACAQPTIKHEYSMSPGQGHHPGLAKALLIPINRVTRPPAGLDVSDSKIESLVASHLRSKGIAVERVAVQDFQRVLDIAANRANEKMMSGESTSVSVTVEFEDLLPYLVEELASDADLVVVPNLAMRAGRYSGGSMIKWDGVKRRETTRRNMMGTTSVASLHIVIYEPDGTRLFSAFGGLDRLFQLSIAKKKYILLEDRLQDEDNLSEGICIAFHPFFGESERCK